MMMIDLEQWFIAKRRRFDFPFLSDFTDKSVKSYAEITIKVKVGQRDECRNY